uniref:UBA domain-containing protein n=1 Tax=Strongyloides stercoralis TaxID=6248 RepID=A0A0K0E8J2_STRER
MYSTNSFTTFPHITGTNFNLIQNHSNQIQGVGNTNQTSNQNIHTPGGSHQLQQPNSIQTGLTNLQNSLALNGNIHGNSVQNSNIIDSSLGWPLFNPLINVPYFDLETYGSVNLDANCSQHKSGVDLPLHDITTLRFFYNFGVHQAKEILLKQQALKNTTSSNAQIIALVQQAQQQNTNNHQNENGGTNILQKHHSIPTAIPPSIVINHNNLQNNSIPNNTNSLNILQGLQSQHNNISSISAPSLASIFAQQSKQIQNPITNHPSTNSFRMNILNNMQSEQSSNQFNYDNLLVQNLLAVNNNSNNLLQQQPSAINHQQSTIVQQTSPPVLSNMSSLSIALQAAKNGHHGAQHYIQELIKLRSETSTMNLLQNNNENIELQQSKVNSSPKSSISVVDGEQSIYHQSNVVVNKPIPSTSSNQTILFENQNVISNNITNMNNTIHQSNNNRFNNDLKQTSLAEKTQISNKIYPQCKSLLQHTKDNNNSSQTTDQLPMGSKRRTEESIKNTQSDDINVGQFLINNETTKNSKTLEKQYNEYSNLQKNDDKVKNNKEILTKTTLTQTDQKKEFLGQQKSSNYDKTPTDVCSSKIKKSVEYNEESKNANTTLTPATALLAASEMHYTQTFTKIKTENNETEGTSNENNIQVSDVKNLNDKIKNDSQQEMLVMGSQHYSNKPSLQNTISSSNIGTKVSNTANNLSETFVKPVNNNQKEQQFVEQPPLAPSLMINFLSCYVSQYKNRLHSHGTSLHLDDHGNPIDYSSRPFDPIFRNAKKETGATIETLHQGTNNTMPEIETPIKESDLVSEAQQSVFGKNAQNSVDINKEKIIELSANSVTGIGEKRAYTNNDFLNPDEKKIKVVKNEDT